MLPSARLFRSRWAALLWAGGVLWTAADIARSAPHEDAAKAKTGATRSDRAGTDRADGAPADINAADLAALSNALDL